MAYGLAMLMPIDSYESAGLYNIGVNPSIPLLAVGRANWCELGSTWATPDDASTRFWPESLVLGISGKLLHRFYPKKSSYWPISLNLYLD